MASDPVQPIPHVDTVIRNIGQLVTIAQQPLAGANGPLRVVSHATVAAYDGKIVWIGGDTEVDYLFQDRGVTPATM